LNNNEVKTLPRNALGQKREYNIELLKNKFNFSKEDCENAYNEIYNENLDHL